MLIADQFAMLALVVTGSTISNADSSSRRYLVLPVSATINEDQTIGAWKRGFACIKAGTLRWAQFEPHTDKGAAHIAAVLRETGVAADLPDIEHNKSIGIGVRRLRVEVVALAANLCQQQYGLLKLGQAGLKGSGQMTVRWRVLNAEGEILSDETTVADFVVTTSSTSFASVLQAGLVANSFQIAARLKL